MRHPEVACSGLSVAWGQIFNGRLIKLHITVSEDIVPDLFDDELHGVRGHAAPVAQVLPRDAHAESRIDVLDAIPRQMIAVARHERVCQQRGRGDAALLQGEAAR